MARTLILDIETAPNVGMYFGSRFDVNITKVMQNGYVLGFAYKWLGEKQIHSSYIWDHDRYQDEPRNDIEVIDHWRELMREADIVVGHNLDAFDTKVMTARALVHNLPPVPLPQSVDTWKLAKRVAKFDSNKLNDLCDIMGFGQKIPTNADLWFGCLMGDEKAQAQMRKYNVKDVALTEKLYLRLKPYDQRHPNMALITGRPEACPRCGTEGSLTAQGVRRTQVGEYRQWRCLKCLGWSRSRLAEKTERPEHV